MYAPVVKSVRRVREHSLGPNLKAVLFTGIEVPDGGIEYAHLLAIYRAGEQDPVAFISSEINEVGAAEDVGLERGERSGSHFLCAFVGNGHRNYGADDKWGDLAAFEQAALERAGRLRDAGDLG